LNATLIDLDEANLLSEAFKTDMKPYLRDYLAL